MRFEHKTAKEKNQKHQIEQRDCFASFWSKYATRYLIYPKNTLNRYASAKLYASTRFFGVHYTCYLLAKRFEISLRSNICYFRLLLCLFVQQFHAHVCAHANYPIWCNIFDQNNFRLKNSLSYNRILYTSWWMISGQSDSNNLIPMQIYTCKLMWDSINMPIISVNLRKNHYSCRHYLLFNHSGIAF